MRCDDMLPAMRFDATLLPRQLLGLFADCLADWLAGWLAGWPSGISRACNSAYAGTFSPALNLVEHIRYGAMWYLPAYACTR